MTAHEVDRELHRLAQRCDDPRSLAELLAHHAERARRQVAGMDRVLLLGAGEPEPFDVILAEIESERELAIGGEHG